MEYPPEFTDGYHVDIEYLYKIYAGLRRSKQDIQAWHITVMPVNIGNSGREEMEALFAPYHQDEKDLDFCILEDDINHTKFYLSEAKKSGEAHKQVELEIKLKELQDQMEQFMRLSPKSFVEKLAEVEAQKHAVSR